MKKIPEYRTSDYKAWAYERMKETNKGHNYQYWSEELDKELKKKGYKMYQWSKGDRHATSSEIVAKEKVTELRQLGYHARIICGYVKTKQHTKMFTVVYKNKYGKDNMESGVQQ